METYEVLDLFNAIYGAGDNTFSRLADPREPDDFPAQQNKIDQWFRLLNPVPLDDALAEVIAHYRATSEPITPSSIYQAWERKAKEQFAQEQTEQQLRKPRQHAQAGYLRASAAFASAKGRDPQEYSEQVSFRRQLTQVQCPFCRARRDKPCKRQVRAVGSSGDGTRELRTRGFHPSRWEAAGLEPPQSPPAGE